MPVWFETVEELDAAVADLAAMPASCRKLLSEVIEHQQKDVTKVSPAARCLEDSGFIFIRGETGYDTSARYEPALWGEEALDVWEMRQEETKGKRKGSSKCLPLRT